MLLLGICTFGMILVGVVSLTASMWWEHEDSKLSRDYMKVSIAATIAAALYVGVLIIL